MYFFQNPDPNLLKADENKVGQKSLNINLSGASWGGDTPKTSVLKHPNGLNRGAGLKYTSICMETKKGGTKWREKQREKSQGGNHEIICFFLVAKI